MQLVRMSRSHRWHQIQVDPVLNGGRHCELLRKTQARRLVGFKLVGIWTIQKISLELQELDRKEEEFITPINRRRLELKRLWNGVLPIHTLPHELLVQLFVDYRDAMDSYRDLMLGRAGVRTGWPDLMLVCRHWRNIIASTPAFWRTVDLRPQINWTELCLTRSSPATIDVTALYRDQSSLAVIYPHAHRFRALFFKAAYGRLLQEALSCFFGNSTVSTVPLLEDLKFTVSQSSVADSVDVNLTSQRFPSLQGLELWATVAPQDLSLYARLRKLSLSFCSNLSFDVLLDALVACMQLEELTLKGMLDRPTLGEWAHGGRIPPRRPPISLPRLRRFTLEDNDALCTSQLLAHLYLQPSAVLNICGYFGRHGSEESSADITPVNNIRAMLPSDHLAALPILAVATYVEMTNTVSDQLYIMECGYGDLIDPETDYPEVLATLAALVRFRPEEDPQMRGLDDLVECFGPAAHLTSLKLYGDKPLAPADTWKSIFRTFPLLEEIDIDGRAKFEVANVFLGLHAASSGASDSDSESGSSVACLNLRQVSVLGLGTVATYEAMGVCFQSRADRGACLQVLNLRRLDDEWHLTFEQHRGFVVALRRAVGCVRVGYRYWDEGQEGY
ncbi:hypothetical protein V8D89_000649 [Ganoderma adspersum]